MATSTCGGWTGASMPTAWKYMSRIAVRLHEATAFLLNTATWRRVHACGDRCAMVRAVQHESL